MQILKTVSGLALLLVGYGDILCAQEWTRFRGPDGSGQVELNLPATYRESDFVWKSPVPGMGHSSPVIWGDKLFVLSADPKTATRHVVCLNADNGKQLWVRDYPSQPHRLHDRSSYASSTPTVDAERVYVAWSDPTDTTLMALDHEGTEIWRLNLGTWVSQHGFGTSPILYEDKVIFFNSQDGEMQAGAPGGETYMMAFDRETGREIWRSPRKSTVVSYSVPCVYQPEGGEPELICCQSNEGIFSLDPDTGKENWSTQVFTQRTVSSPVIAGGLIFGTNGSGGGQNNYLAAVRPGKNAKLAYELRKQAAYVPTPVARGDLLFVISDIGVASCLDAKTGSVHWAERIDGTFSGTPIRVGDKIFCINDDGALVSFAADKDFQFLGSSPLGEPSRATPAVSGGRMFLRTYSHVICVGRKTS